MKPIFELVNNCLQGEKWMERATKSIDTPEKCKGIPRVHWKKGIIYELKLFGLSWFT